LAEFVHAGGHTQAVTTETAQTLDRGLRLLTLVAESQGGLTVTEAAAALGVGRAVVYRLVTTLAAHGLVRRDAEGRIRLGLAVVQLARRAQPLLAEVAMPALRRLAEDLGATAHLTVADGEALALAVVEPSWTAFHVAYRTGSRHPLDRGAAGQAILAARTGEGSPYVVSSGELQAGAHGVAAPLPPECGVEASVGVVAMTELDSAVVGPRVVAAAQEIAAALR
jgi:DNA-binding IclR family transcriptional regulator